MLVVSYTTAMAPLTTALTTVKHCGWSVKHASQVVLEDGERDNRQHDGGPAENNGGTEFKDEES